VRTKPRRRHHRRKPDVPFAIFNLYQQRFDERIAYARELLKGQV
jgi:carboxyl-terminal processing protease